MLIHQTNLLCPLESLACRVLVRFTVIDLERCVHWVIISLQISMPPFALVQPVKPLTWSTATICVTSVLFLCASSGEDGNSLPSEFRFNTHTSFALRR